MKNKVRFLGLFLVVVFALSAFAGCNSTSSLPGKQPAEGMVTDSTKLPDAYRYQNGIWYLTVPKETPTASPVSFQAWSPLQFDSLEAMKTSLLELSFSKNHLQIIHSEYSGKIPLIDPRLIYPLDLPKGVSATSAWLVVPTSFDNHLNPTSYDFGTRVNESFTLGTDYSVSMNYRGGTGNSYLTMHLNGFIDPDKGYSLEEYDRVKKTTYNGQPALTLEKIDDKTLEKTVYLRYIAEKNDRTYYVEYATTYRDETTMKVTDSVLTVQSFYKQCEYRYAIENPTEECVDNFFKYDPFTYVEIVE